VEADQPSHRDLIRNATFRRNVETAGKPRHWRDEAETISWRSTQRISAHH
jgi:hypothetical protein